AETLDVGLCLPAIGQGAIGIECRADDPGVNSLIAVLDDPDTRTCVLAERALNTRLEGGCQVPIAAHAVLDGGTIRLDALVGRPDGSEIIRGHAIGPARDAEAIGLAVAEDLLARGA